MKSLARLLFIGVILAFTAGSVVHAVDMSGMNAKMAAMTGGGDCGGCGGDDDGGAEAKTCADPCVTPAIAVLPAATTFAAPGPDDAGLQARGFLAGRAGPPDPHPPKPTLN